MRAHHQMSLSFILSLLAFLLAHQSTTASVPRIQDLINRTNLRRILHQPMFPEDSSPPPALILPPPPQPPAPTFPGPDQPFFPEVPNGQNPNQVNQSPPPPASANSRAVPNPMATQPAKPAKKVAIAISVGIVTLGMLSGLAFYLYKLRVKSPDESQKLVGENSQRNTSNTSDDSRMPPSTFLYIGTVEPSSRQTVSESNGANGSPYHKLISIKRSERYRPSPELQPLPPLSKPPLPPSNNSPPAMSSSDEESHDFYTPHGSSTSMEDGYYTPNVKQSRSSKDSSLTIQPRIEARRSTSPVPHSKRTSPRSRLSVSSSPDTKSAVSLTNQPPATSPSRPPQPPTPPAAPQIECSPPTTAYATRRAKFSAPPPPPDMSRFHSVDNHSQQSPKISIPPPPPPPPLPLSVPQISAFSTESRPTSRDSRSLAMPRVINLIPKPIPGIVKIKPIEEANDGTNSSDRIDTDDAEGSKPKLKPLHWDKVRATSDRATVWDQLKSSSFQLNEDVMESLFGCNSTISVKKEETRRSNLPPVEKENRVLDPKKSQNIAILLRALNVTRDEVCEALLEGNPECLSAEILETLVKMAPTKEEEIKLRDYRGEMSKLGTAERFLKAILDVPFAFKRAEAMLYRANFDMEVNYLRNSFQTLEAASEELKNSRLFLKLLEAVLRTGNRMNIGTNRGEARAFKLDTLLKLVDIKGTDGKTTLLHFVVQEIIRSEGSGSDPSPEDPANKPNSRLNEQNFNKQGLQVVGGLGRELGNVKKAAGMDSDVLSGYVSKLEMGLEKVILVIQCEKPNMQVKFFESMKIFLKEAEAEIVKVKAYERKALTLVKEVTEYFHGDAAKEGAYPLRIFMIVRDFLSILDHVCKEVGQMQDKTLVGSARSFRIPPTASLPVLNRYNVRQDRSSDEESSSP